MFSCVDLNDYSLDELKSLINLAVEIKKNSGNFSKKMNGKILASLFFEPSTRTRFSFQTAMFRLGGQFLGFSNPGVSSVAKGESFSDTIRIMSIYADLLVIRHFCDGAAKAAAIFSGCPVINAGDGVHLHPTQTLADLLTLKQLKNRFNKLTFGFCGDLKFGRPVNSLVRALCRFDGNRFVFVSTKELKISNFLKSFIEKSGCSFFESSSLEESISKLDVLYMTRVQKERFKNIDDYEKQKGCFKLTTKLLKSASPNLVVMHPLPRVDEIDYDVDFDSRAAYFLQAANGIYARMALILKLVSGDFRVTGEKFNFTNNFRKIDRVCCNENCISRFDLNLPKFFLEECNFLRCAYCDERLV